MSPVNLAYKQSKGEVTAGLTTAFSAHWPSRGGQQKCWEALTFGLPMMSMRRAPSTLIIQEIRMSSHGMSLVVEGSVGAQHLTCSILSWPGAFSHGCCSDGSYRAVHCR